MRIVRLAGVAAAICAIVAILAMPAVAAVQLPIKLAGEKSFIFAKHTCDHDGNCIKYGVTNCSRVSLHVVLCRIFDERSTPAQGRYGCTRVVRVALDPITFRVVVTGQSPWQCQ